MGPERTNDAVLRALINQARNDKAQFPQYRTHFDGYSLVKVTRKIKTKLGTAFEAGDLAIMSNHPYHRIDPAQVTVYSFRNRTDTSIPKLDVVAL